MKKIFTTILVTILLGNIALSQNEVVTQKEQESISKMVSIIGEAIKQSNHKLLNNYLAENFTSMGYKGSIAKDQVLPQMLTQLPKGNLEITKISKMQDNQFNLDVSIMPMQVSLDVILNVNYKIIELSVIQDNVPQSNSSTDKKLLERISLPFHLVDGFILIDAEINGKRGKLMFDTGNSNNLLLNNNYLELSKESKIGEGTVGSGQQIEIFTDVVSSVSMGLDLNMGPQNVEHANFDFTQIGITSDMMGFLGYDFIKDYEFIIDYDDQVIEMYLISENKNNKFYNEDDIVVELDFSTPFMPNIPYVNFDYKGQKIIANFDTGNQGSLNLNESETEAFVASGVINKIESNGHYGQPMKIAKYTIDNLTYNGVQLDKIKNIINHENSGMPITKENEFDLGIGYQFLKNYKSIWNFKTKKIILLKN